MTSKAKMLIAAAIALSAGLAVSEWSRRGPGTEAPGDQAASAVIGQPAPDFSLPDYKSNLPVRLSEYKGQVVLVNFWATWCPPCREEIPAFLAVHKALHPQGFEILGLSMDAGGTQDVTPFAKEFGITYPILIGNSTVTAKYGGVRGIPESFLVDRQGILRQSWQGAIPKETLEAAVKPLL